MELTVKSLEIGYETALASDLNFSVLPSQALGLIGANGTGKTTLLRTLLGLTAKRSGEIQFNPSLPSLRADSRIGVVWQDAGLPFNVSPARWIKQLAKIHNTEIDTELLSKLAAPSHNRQIRSLSGGEKQRLALYSALFFRPEFLILDEPTVGLDEQSREVFYELIQNHLTAGGAAIMTSHYAIDISASCSQILNLGESQPNSVGAIFNTAAPLPAEIIATYQIAQISNGYLISSADHWEIVTKIAANSDIQITNYRVTNHA